MTTQIIATCANCQTVTHGGVLRGAIILCLRCAREGYPQAMSALDKPHMFRPERTLEGDGGDYCVECGLRAPASIHHAEPTLRPARYPALYELEPTGVNGRMEANGTVFHFCGNSGDIDSCRNQYLRASTEQVKSRLMPGMSSPVEEGVCDFCSKLLDESLRKQYASICQDIDAVLTDPDLATRLEEGERLRRAQKALRELAGRAECDCQPCPNCDGVERSDDCTDHKAVDCQSEEYKLRDLIDAFGNAEYECGEWASDDEDAADEQIEPQIEQLQDFGRREQRAEDARQALTDFIENDYIAQQLKARFAWLGTDDEVSGCDVVEALQDWYSEVSDDPSEKEEKQMTDENLITIEQALRLAKHDLGLTKRLPEAHYTLNKVMEALAVVQRVDHSDGCECDYCAERAANTREL